MHESWTAKIDRISSFYTGLVSKYGHDPRACDYGRASSQRRKFEILAEATDYAGLRVLDVGCGFADFADFLSARFDGVTYEGVDITPAMVKTAQQLHPELKIRQIDIMAEDPGAPYDVVTANGIFYLLGPGGEADMQRLIRRMVELSSKVIAFNSLSSRSSQIHQANEFLANPASTVEFCRSLVPRVVLRHDYLPHDFSIYLYKESIG